MIPSRIEYRCPESVEELLELLSKYRDASRVLAGGQSLIPALKVSRLEVSVLLDLRRIPGLGEVEPTESGIRVGARVTHRTLETSDLLRARCPLLAEVAGRVGDPQVRNLGTLVGAVCQADPAGDYPAALAALDAEVEIASPRGARVVRAADFIQGPFETAIEPEEFVRSVRVPATEGLQGTYLRRRLGQAGFALAGVAVLLGLEDGHVTRLALGVTGVAARPFRAREVEGQLGGRELTAEVIGEGARGLGRGRELLEDAAASAEYRGHLADVLARRALLHLGERLGVC